MGGCAFSSPCSGTPQQPSLNIPNRHRKSTTNGGPERFAKHGVEESAHLPGNNSFSKIDAPSHLFPHEVHLRQCDLKDDASDDQHSLDASDTATIDDSINAAEIASGGFLLHAEHLTTVHFAAGCFHELPTIGTSFMRGGLVLTTVHFHGDCFKNVKVIQSSFLRGCVNLETVEFGPRSFENCRRIESHFMAGCSKLKCVTFGAGCFQNVSNIDYSFLAKCSSLESVTFSGGCFSRVAVVGSVFMSRCTMLKSVRFDDGCFGEVSGLGAGFLSGCPRLESVAFRGGCLAKLGCLNDELLTGSVTRSLQEVQIDPDAQVLHDALTAAGVKNIKIMKNNWSWERHYTTALSACVRTGVLAIHQGITYKDSHGDEQYLPNEVAYEICGYINVRW